MWADPIRRRGTRKEIWEDKELFHQFWLVQFTAFGLRGQSSGWLYIDADRPPVFRTKATRKPPHYGLSLYEPINSVTYPGTSVPSKRNPRR